jgi:hypothetical protein
MALEGNIRDFGLPGIFQLIGMEKRTGILTINGSEDTVEITFHDGDVVWAASKNRKPEERLGRVLLKSGRISEENLNKALEAQKQNMQRLGYILVKAGHIDERELRESLQIQVLETIYRLFRWKDGTYSFQPRASVDFQECLIQPVRAEGILMEGIRMLDEWPLIMEKIPNFNLVPRSVSMGSLTFDHNKLEEPLRQIYELVDGQRTVKELIDSSFLGEFDTCNCLKELMVAGLVELVEGKISAAAPGAGIVARKPGKKRAWALMVAPGVILLLGVISFVLAGMNPKSFLGLGPATPKGELELQREAYNLKKLRLEESLGVYYLAHGTYPADLSLLVEKNLLQSRDLLNPAGPGWEYKNQGGSYSLK